MELAAGRSGRRPGIEPAPSIRACLEQPGLGEFFLSFTLEVLRKESQLDLLAEEFAGFGGEVQIAERLATSARPSAVPPWTHHQSVGGEWAVFFQRMEELERSGQILGVEPPSHEQRSRRDALHMRR